MRSGLRSSWRGRLRRGKHGGQARGHFSGEQLPSGGGREIEQGSNDVLLLRSSYWPGSVRRAQQPPPPMELQHARRRAL